MFEEWIVGQGIATQTTAPPEDGGVLVRAVAFEDIVDHMIGPSWLQDRAAKWLAEEEAARIATWAALPWHRRARARLRTRWFSATQTAAYLLRRAASKIDGLPVYGDDD